MDMAVATMTGYGRDPEVPVISAAMKNVATTARTIGSGSTDISGRRGAGKSTVLNKFDTRDAAWKSEQDIRVAIAAPVDYDAREFIIHLFTELCTRVAAEAHLPDRIARQTQRGKPLTDLMALTSHHAATSGGIAVSIAKVSRPVPARCDGDQNRAGPGRWPPTSLG
jgi:hypothetical protein